MTLEAMVEKFQCPGCVVGGDTKCGRYDPGPDFLSCKSHVLGTIISGAGHIALGMPKGFNRPGPDDARRLTRNVMDLRLYPKEGAAPLWNKLNVPVWAMEEDGFLFVRVFMPRVNFPIVEVYEGKTVADIRETWPAVLDVATFADEID